MDEVPAQADDVRTVEPHVVALYRGFQRRFDLILYLWKKTHKQLTVMNTVMKLQHIGNMLIRIKMLQLEYTRY